MADHPIHIVFAGGGTGGHLFPGLAVAERIVADEPSTRITFVGSGKRFEREHVTAAHFDYLATPCRPRPKRPRDTLPFLVENLAGYLVAARFLREEQAAAVVGLGGYASVPLARAATRYGIPLVLLEQNALPGRATRWLARWATSVCLAMEEARAGLKCRCPVRVTGTPIRTGFTQTPVAPADTIPLDPDTSNTQLLVLGGSSGARSLNENVPRALYKIRSRLAGWRLVHQSGPAGLEATQRLYRKLGLEADVVSFIADMPKVLRQTGLVVCRAGGTTLAELAALGVPALLLPYPHATDDHQRRNADLLTTSGGSITLDERELAGRFDDHLAGAISGLLADPLGRARMSAAMRRLARPNAATDVAHLIRSLVNDRLPLAGIRGAA